MPLLDQSLPARRAGAWLADAGLVGALLALTWWVGVRSTDFAGSPRGADALDHAATVQLLMENFPHLLWNPSWFGGMPSVPGLYPPGRHRAVPARIDRSGREQLDQRVHPHPGGGRAVQPGGSQPRLHGLGGSRAHGHRAAGCEAKFIAQWNSLGWIEAAPAQQGFYQHNPEAYRYLGPSGSYRNYEVRQPSPVLAATDVPPVFVIGPYDNYNLLLRSLAITDDGPSQVIPVEGTAYIDDYSLAELEQFPVLFLYGFQAHDPATAAGLIDAYVRAGGGVIADVAGVAGDGQLATQLVQHGAPLPVTSWEPAELSGAWGFRNSRSPLTRGIDLGQ